MKRTPGPWLVIEEAQRKNASQIRGAKGEEIAFNVYTPNAHLMAAAPDLLKILKEIVGDADLRELMKEPDCGDCGSTLERAKETIAMAETGSPLTPKST